MRPALRGTGLAHAPKCQRPRRRRPQAPRLPLAKHNRCIMFSPAGRLRSARGAGHLDFERNDAARTVSSAMTTRGASRLSPATPCPGAQRRHDDALSDEGRSCGSVRRDTPARPHMCTARPPVATPYRRPRSGDAPAAEHRDSGHPRHCVGATIASPKIMGASSAREGT